jgi:hypothetical protein
VRILAVIRTTLVEISKLFRDESQNSSWDSKNTHKELTARLQTKHELPEKSIYFIEP